MHEPPPSPPLQMHGFFAHFAQVCVPRPHLLSAALACLGTQCLTLSGLKCPVPAAGHAVLLGITFAAKHPRFPWPGVALAGAHHPYRRLVFDGWLGLTRLPLIHFEVRKMSASELINP